MRNTAKVVLATVLLASTAMNTHAEGLLGGIVGHSNALVTINEGPASDSGLVNIGLGGGDGNVVDLDVGSGQPLASADVSTNDGLGVTANVGGNLANATASVEGSGGLLDANVDLLNGSVGGGLDADVNVGSIPGAPGAPGAPDNPNMPGIPGPVLNPNLQIGNNSNSTMPSCDPGTSNNIAQLIRNTRTDASWAQASGVKVQRVAVCPELKVWLAGQLQGSALGNSLRAAVGSDPLLNASLSRTSYGADRVFAINKQGSQLVVYVY